MTAKQQINAIASAVHCLKVLAEEHSSDAKTGAEQLLIMSMDDCVVYMTDKIEKFFDSGGMTEQEWDATASLEDYNETEQEIIANVAKES